MLQRNFNNLKFKKFHRIKINYNKVEVDFFYPKFYEYGIQLKSYVHLTHEQLESVRRVIRRFFKKNVLIKMNLLLNSSLSKKAISVRMGKGKGRHHKWVASLNKGHVFMEILFMDKKYISFKNYYFIVLRLIRMKLPIDVKIIKLRY